MPALAVGNLPGGPIMCWRQLADSFHSHLDKWGWIFRGQSDAGWSLSTSLERAIVGLSTVPRGAATRNRALATGLVDRAKKYPVLQLEAGLVRQFKRQCHHHTEQIAEPRHTLEWLALMQHYGAPTRLLDWTHSFYAAVYFALDGASETKPGDMCAVWALNADWITSRFRRRFPKLWKHVDRDRNMHKFRGTFDAVFANRAAFVCPVNPYRLNDRLVIQQGKFLCPGDVSLPFDDNLAELQVDRFRGTPRLRRDATQNLIKIEISSSATARADILRSLHRMNMTAATLYPGLPGFAKSLKDALVFPAMLKSGRRYE